MRSRKNSHQRLHYISRHVVKRQLEVVTSCRGNIRWLSKVSDSLLCSCSSFEISLPIAFLITSLSLSLSLSVAVRVQMDILLLSLSIKVFEFDFSLSLSLCVRLSLYTILSIHVFCPLRAKSVGQIMPDLVCTPCKCKIAWV